MDLVNVIGYSADTHDATIIEGPNLKAVLNFG